MQNKFRLVKGISLIFFLFLCILPAQSWAQGIVCITPDDGVNGVSERTQLQSTLANLGYTVRITSTPSTSDCQVFVSYIGEDGLSEGLTAWIQAGHGMVQIGDWGVIAIPENHVSVTDGSPQTIEVMNPSHPITTGLPSSWTGRGFWAYGYPTWDYIAWASDVGDPNLVRAGGHDRALSTRLYGAGRLVLIGWNVYGSAATLYDVQVLHKAIAWAGGANLYTCIAKTCYYTCNPGSCPSSHCFVTINIPGMVGCMDRGSVTYCAGTPYSSSCSIYLPLWGPGL